MSNAIQGPLFAGGRSVSGMPRVGVGGSTTNPGSSSVKTAILNAIQLGYRHIHTIISNKNEHHQAYHEAIEEALKVKHVNSREDLFISCKIQYNPAGPEAIIQDVNTFLQNVNLEHVDLLLIQFPGSANPGELENDIPDSDLASAWKAMENCQSLGLTRFIGTFNFSHKLLENTLKLAKTVPFTNQVGMETFLKGKELRRLCMSNRISILVSCNIGGKDKFMEMVELGGTLLLESFSNEQMKQVLEMFPQN